MKRNTDMCSMTLAKILHFSGQFLDGRLESIILEPADAAYGWKVDASQFLGHDSGGHLGPI